MPINNCQNDLNLGKIASKVKFLSKFGHFLSDLRIQFEPLLGRECASVCHDLKTEKEGIYAKMQEYERSNCHTSELHDGNQDSKVHF